MRKAHVYWFIAMHSALKFEQATDLCAIHCNSVNRESLTPKMMQTIVDWGSGLKNVQEYSGGGGSS